MPNLIAIHDFSDPALDLYARLNEAQLRRFYEPDPGLFIAESPKVIERALYAGYQPISILTEDRHIAGELHAILERCGDLPVYCANAATLTQLTGFSLTRGALCAMRRKALPTVEAICADKNRIAVLEGVVNPTNVGAIFRSAAALNMDAVLLSPDCSDPFYRRSARVSMGTVFQIPWTYLPRTGGMEPLQQLGFATAAMALSDHAVGIDDPQLQQEEKLAVFLGAEGDGLSPQTISACDYTVCIPMAHGVDSLNVAAASAVAFWELRKR